MRAIIITICNQRMIDQNPTSNIRILSQLPPRIKGPYLDSKPKVKIDTNLFKVTFDEKTEVAIYSVKTSPTIQYDNRALRLKLLNTAMEKMKDQLGEYVINGMTVYCCYSQEKKKNYTASVDGDGNTYQLSFSLVRQVKLSDINDPDKKKAAVPYGFLNNLMKAFLMKLDYHEVGKSRKYYKHKDKIDLPNAGVVLYKGYATAFTLLQSGLYLKIDSSTRVVQNCSALSAINGFYALHKSDDKEIKRTKLLEEFKGKTVMANYGNHRYWRVEGIQFDTDTDLISVNPDTNQTLTQYYKEKYNLVISKTKQPLFKAELNEKRKKGDSQPQKQEETILLIPEFCLMSGLPDDFDEKKRRDVSRETIIAPDIKRRRIDDLIKKLNNDLDDFGPKSISKALTLKIEAKSETINAINLGPPHVALGDNNSIDRDKSAQFMLFNKPLYSSNISLNIMMFAPENLNTKEAENVIGNTCKNLRLKNSITVQKLNFRERNVISQIEHFLEDTDGKYSKFNIFWFVLPFNMKTMYGKIKRTAMESRHPKLTQMTVQSTFSKKGFMSICTKILLQMASKVGNALWLPKAPKAAGNNTMMIGIDTAADSVQKGTVVAFCSNVTGDFTKFFSHYYIQQNGNENPEQTGLVIADAMNAFAKENGKIPEQIIVMRNGCADSQISTALQNEVKQVQYAVERLSKSESKSPCLTYIILDKNVNQKLFKQGGDKVVNPAWGTLVNSDIVSNDYDFYMIAQHCNMGTVKPAYYKVIYSDSKVEEGVLQELLYTQCFNYMNWTGSVRVPACVQYAKKLSTLIASFVNNKDQGSYPNKLYFI